MARRNPQPEGSRDRERFSQACAAWLRFVADASAVREGVQDRGRDDGPARQCSGGGRERAPGVAATAEQAGDGYLPAVGTIVDCEVPGAVECAMPER